LKKCKDRNVDDLGGDQGVDKAGDFVIFVFLKLAFVYLEIYCMIVFFVFEKWFFAFIEIS
jgi:hypothetical protein